VEIDEATFVELIIGRLDEANRVATWILGDAAAGEDAVQEAAAHAWARRGDLRDIAAAPAWFGRIVVNSCRDELRRRSSRPRVADADLADDLADPSIRDGDAADRDEVGHAVARLKPDFQVILALRFGADLTVPAIADRLGIPEGTAKTRLRDALAMARDAIAAERSWTPATREARP
jgi:RNA polymerase sigma-70 factor, ECF subfamily